MMLGMNAPKAVARGEYAKAIRKAVHDSIEAIKNGKVPEPKNHKYHFEWRVQSWNIIYLAVDKKYQHMNVGAEIVDDVCAMARQQSLAGCVFVTVLALHKDGYSAVPFYEKCHFAKKNSSS